jgi:hypothetical protein
MFKNFNKLPDDVILIISSYYGNKISKELSEEINNQRMLRIIKERECYNNKSRTWNIRNFYNILSLYTSQKLIKLYNNNIWKNQLKIIDKMWNSLSLKQHNEIITIYFPYLYNVNSKFITFNEFFYSNFGYYLYNIPCELKSNYK